MSVAQIELSQAERIQAWVSDTLANRAVVEMVSETNRWTARIKGITSIAVLAASQGQALTDLREDLHQWASMQLATGKALPRWERPVSTVNPAVKRLIYVGRLRDFIHERMAEWGITQRQNLPPALIPAILSDIEQVIARHIAGMRNAD